MPEIEALSALSSASRASATCPSEVWNSLLIVLAEPAGSSIVRVTMLSASLLILNVPIVSCSVMCSVSF